MIRIRWAVDAFSTESGALGYTRANTWTRAAARDAGMVEDESADLVVHYCWPDPRWFKPVADKVNILCSMYESPYLNPMLIRAFPQSQAIITPSRYCADIFANYTDKPIHVVPLGIDPAIFRLVKRSRPRNRPFRWLWLGAWNVRKGCREVLGAWYKDFIGRRDCELYIKTGKHPQVHAGQNGNFIFDDRLLSDEALHALYASADGFVYPTMGEGFALGLLEAQATGLPCIAPLRTGETEYADSGTCLNVKTVPHIVHSDAATEGDRIHKEVVARVPLDALAERMEWIMTHWVRAKRMGLRAHKRAQQFTWAAAGRKFVTALEEIAGTGRATCAA